MQQRIKPCCINNHVAEKICRQNGCIEPALICNKSTQNCKNSHDNCIMSVNLDSLIIKLLQEGKISQARDLQILDCLDQITKMITIFKEQYLKTMQKPQLRLQGNSRKLFKLLRDGSVKDILPQFVSETLRRIVKPTTQKINQQRLKIQFQLSKHTKGIKQYLQSILSLGRKQVIQNTKKVEQSNKNSNIFHFSFTNQLCYSKCFKVQRQNYLKMIKDDDNNVRFALIVPSLEINKNQIQTIKLKIIKRNYYLYVGMCHKQTIINNNYKVKDFYKPNHGVYFCANNGLIANSIDSTKNWKQSNMNFQKDDILSLIFNPLKMQLIICNNTKQIRTSLNFKFKDNDPLHFCISTRRAGNEVQIIN